MKEVLEKKVARGFERKGACWIKWWMGGGDE